MSEEVIIQVIIYYSHTLLFLIHKTFLFCFWMRKKSRREIDSSISTSAHFCSTSVVHPESAHQKGIWMAVLSYCLKCLSELRILNVISNFEYDLIHM